jgi:hypothetical protein
MYLIYLDEAGNTWNNLDDRNQPIHFISGIAIHVDDLNIIEQKIMDLLPLYAPYSQNFDFEFHWIDLIQW